MKVLSVKQPWASLIAQGFKDVENRSWKIKDDCTCQILIHSSAKPAKGIWDALSDDQRLLFPQSPKIQLPYGAIIGAIDVVGYVKNSNSGWAEKDCWNWVLRNPILFNPPILGIKGHLGIWHFDLPDNYCRIIHR